MATGVPRCGTVTVRNATLNSSSVAELGESEADNGFSVLAGVAMGLFASVFINLGQNLQALGLQASDEMRANPCKSRTWVMGMAVFIFGSMINFAAFSFAPASILVPLEAVQFVTNVLFSKCVLGARVPLRMVAGVALAVTGTAVTVVFGPSDDRCFRMSDLSAFWSSGLWWGYCAATALIAASCFCVHRRYARARRAGTLLPHAHIVEPAAFALSSALMGGAQMIVHSKAIAEVFEILILKISDPSLDEPYPPLTWYFYVELALLSTCGVVWLYKMNESLGLYDPLFIIPLMQSSYILFGVIAGGIYFQEFGALSRKVLFGQPLHYWGWVLFFGGMGSILLGLALIAPPPAAAAAAAAAAAEGSTRGSMPSGRSSRPTPRGSHEDDYSCDYALASSPRAPSLFSSAYAEAFLRRDSQRSDDTDERGGGKTVSSAGSLGEAVSRGGSCYAQAYERAWAEAPTAVGEAEATSRC